MFDSQYGAASFFIKLQQLMMNTEKPVWEDKGQPILSHQHLLSELGVVSNPSETILYEGDLLRNPRDSSSSRGVYIEALLFLLFCPNCTH